MPVMSVVLGWSIHMVKVVYLDMPGQLVNHCLIVWMNFMPKISATVCISSFRFGRILGWNKTRGRKLCFG